MVAAAKNWLFYFLDRFGLWLFYFLDRFGLPTLIIFAVGWWTAGHVIDPLITNHVQFLEEQVNMTKCQAETLTTLTTVVDNMRASHDTQIALLRQVLAAQKKAAETPEIPFPSY